MSDLFLRRISNTAPLGYIVPPFPSLYWPFPVKGDQARYLYHAYDIWSFTVVWTLIFYGVVFLATSGYAVVMQWRNWKIIWIVPLFYVLIGGIEAVIAGSVIGGLLGGVYDVGIFRMSTWVPFAWGAINTLVIVLSSFAIQGGL